MSYPASARQYVPSHPDTNTQVLSGIRFVHHVSASVVSASQKSSKIRRHQSNIFAKIKQNQVNSHADSDLSQCVPPISATARKTTIYDTIKHYDSKSSNTIRSDKHYDSKSSDTIRSGQYNHRKSSKIRPHHSDIFAKIKQNRVNPFRDSDLDLRVTPQPSTTAYYNSNIIANTIGTKQQKSSKIKSTHSEILT
ncbi:hypothetical protein DEU56DRAFT_756336 [Suillus clintonianus]|uniref:uncharacterized protein n=1 Tax=Suillus clintonianus TaxID=1904413 RepID=UPI001B8848A3|nr:uncharacterized protein DEU56DRAFT_756336 [Suillus clintonianus]KAG2136430.1 hypothetical protein DEU56DRAFT_756336 [Suillus clintonianus]